LESNNWIGGHGVNHIIPTRRTTTLAIAFAPSQVATPVLNDTKLKTQWTPKGKFYPRLKVLAVDGLDCKLSKLRLH